MSDSQERRARAIEEVRALAERRLSPEEFDAYAGAPVSPEEEAAMAELIAWFRRRYPTPGARLAYARRAYARWRKSLPHVHDPTEEVER